MPLKLVDLLQDEIPQADLLGLPVGVGREVLPREDNGLYELIRDLRKIGISETLIRDAACISVQYARDISGVCGPVDGLKMMDKILRVPAGEVLNVSREDMVDEAVKSARLTIEPEAVKMVFDSIYNAFEGNLLCDASGMFKWIIDDVEVLDRLKRICNEREVVEGYPLLKEFVHADAVSLDILFRLCDEYALMDIMAGAGGKPFEIPLFNTMPSLLEVENVDDLASTQVEKYYPVYLSECPTADQVARMGKHMMYLTKEASVAEKWFPYYCSVSVKGLRLFVTMAGLKEGKGCSMGEGFYQPKISTALTAVYEAGAMMPGVEFLLSKTMRRGFVNCLQFRGIINRQAFSLPKPILSPLSLQLSKVKSMSGMRELFYSVLGSRGLIGNNYFESAGQEKWISWYSDFNRGQYNKDKPNKVMRTRLLERPVTPEEYCTFIKEKYFLDEEQVYCVAAYTYMSLSGALVYQADKISVRQ